MIKLIFIMGAGILSCGPVKTTRSLEKADSVKTNISTDQPVQVNAASQTSMDTTPVSKKDMASIPTCIKKKIDSFKVMQKHEQPQSVTEYMYKGKKVYYIVMPCCDFFSEVYDAACTFLGSPDGGITGKGDGKLPDFFKETTKEKRIWEAAK